MIEKKLLLGLFVWSCGGADVEKVYVVELRQNFDKLLITFVNRLHVITYLVRLLNM